MIQGLIGRKLGMTQMFDESGVVHPVTVIECGPNVITQVKSTDTDGYEAVQLGFGIDKRLTKPEQGHRKSSGYMSRTLREVKATTFPSTRSDKFSKQTPSIPASSWISRAPRRDVASRAA